MVSIMAARWPRWGSWPLAAWLLLPLFGCGATLQAEDQATVAAVQGARKLYDAKQYEQARERATALLAKSPDSAAAHYVRALAAIKLSDYAAARADLQKARQLDPLLVFAKSKDEFEAAWRVARENTMDALGGTVTTPPPPGEAAAPKPASAPKPKKIVSKDPLARVLAAEGPVLHDASGQKVLGPAQLKSMQNAVSNLAARKLTLKMLVLKPGAGAEAEAKRLFTAAALDDDVLLIVGVPGGKVAAYTPLKTPEALRSEVAKVVTGAAGVSLPRRMMLVATAVGGALQAPP
ncbi:MAG: hypothetical protein HUU35_17515, partial [Armatimonadetes bacterium]|nr:hypothetical protein [Armatimonadota bacterium]